MHTIINLVWCRGRSDGCVGWWMGGNGGCGGSGGVDVCVGRGCKGEVITKKWWGKWGGEDLTRPPSCKVLEANAWGCEAAIWWLVGGTWRLRCWLW
jgi:hypothetical protein